MWILVINSGGHTLIEDFVIMNMELHKFSDIQLSDPFFDSLKNDYPGFSNWYAKKAETGAKALIQKNESGLLQAFLYLKKEEETITDVNPPMPTAKRLKVGTFKIDAHNTKLGECFVKKIMQYALYLSFDEIYVTVFPKHASLIKLLMRFGFVEYGTKGEGSEPEKVFVKSMKKQVGDVLLDYPFVHSKDTRKFVLAIKPEYHTILFPDSILNTESRNKDVLVKDVSHTNSIHKIFLASMKGLEQLKRGDILLIYRTGDGAGPAKYRSVISSVCVVEEIKTAKDFASIEEYLKYVEPYSIFSEADLRTWFVRNNMVVIKMTYNVAFNRRITRNELIQEVGLSEGEYWGFFQITDEQFKDIIERGQVDESVIVD